MTQITLSELPPILQTLINQAKKTGETLLLLTMVFPWLSFLLFRKNPY